jgi:DNA-binding LacI/PurR family transcriptional regulator
MPYTSSDARYRGFCAAIAAAGLDPSAMPVERSTINRQHAAIAGRALLTAHPDLTAVFAHSDVQALGLLDAARELELRVPEDLSVMGFDGLEVSEWAGLTTVAQPLFESGKRGAELLLEVLAGSPSGGRVEWLELAVVERTSTGPAPKERS